MTCADNAPAIATAAAADRTYHFTPDRLALLQPASRDRTKTSRLAYFKGKPVADWTILCDFDGTIALDDTTDTLLEKFARPGWQVLETAWREGRIGSHDCMAGQVALLDMDRAELDAHLAECTIDPAFAAFVKAAHGAGAHIEVLSDGLDYAIRSILGRNGLDWLPITSNRLESAGSRKWRLTFPNASATCRVASGTCKCARADWAQAARKQVLLIGDGGSDFCVAGAADFVFAKGKLIAHCLAQDIPHVAIQGFADAFRLLPDLIAGKLIASPVFSNFEEAPSHA
jgi:2-hydroxy-3-keto-5-methylthiopentenyl-1-phosphate phosphatase